MISAKIKTLISPISFAPSLDLSFIFIVVFSVKTVVVHDMTFWEDIRMKILDIFISAIISHDVEADQHLCWDVFLNNILT